MKRRIALLLVICLLASTVPAATAGGAVDDGILDNGIELADVGEQDMTGPLEPDGIELEADALPDELGDILPEGDMPELELGESLELPEGEALLPESEAQGDASEANDDSSDFTIENGVLTKYNGAGGNVVIPDGVTRIGERAFEFTDITSVTVPEGVISIDDEAFYWCISLESVVIPGSVTEIGNGAFCDCSSLKEIAVPASVTRIAEETFMNCGSLTTVQIPGSVTKIGKKAFANCSELTDVRLPDGLTSIGNGAFTECGKLGGVTLPDSLTSIGENAFSGSGLTAVTIPKNVTVIKINTFERCRNLAELVISNGVTRIQPCAFSACVKLQKVTIPDSVVRIGQEAFEFCTNLKEVIIPRNTSVSKWWVFYECDNLTIKGFTGSSAEKYANENGIPFVAIDEPTPEISIPKALTLGVKETYALDAAGASFKSSNATVAAVDKKGVVTAKKAGSATVTVTFSGKKVGTCKVTVVKAPTSISFAEKSVTLGVKETLALKPTITKGSHASYTWSVKNKKIATVDKDGVVTGKKAGKTTVTVKTHNGKKATVTVTVQKAPTKVSLSKKAVTLGVKEALTLTPKIAKGAHTSFTWTVEDSKIATVTKSGKITGKKAGKTTVTVKTHNGKKATVKVTVMKAPTKVSLEAKTMALGVKESVKLKPEIARDAHTSYTWTVKNKKIATVTKDGKLTGKKAGKTTVTVKTHNGKKATMTVNVMAAPDSITLSGKSRELTVGDAIMLMPTLPKKTASRITWSSSKKSVASVDASGVVRALKKGTAKITAKTFNGKKAVCTVTVGEGASYLAFDAEALSIGVKEKVTLKPQVNEGAKVKYTWTTGNKKVATVSKKGVVTGVKAGTTDITVKTQNGLTATVKVTVLAAPSKVTLNKGKATLPENQTLQLKATLPKKTASQIKWSTDNKKVATVDENGLVTAVAVGKATITAQTFNGKKATCVVTVRDGAVLDYYDMFFDAYDGEKDVNVDFVDLKFKTLSPEDYDDSEEMKTLIEEYNGMVSEINDDTDEFYTLMGKLIDAIDTLDASAGRTNIIATKDGVKVENDFVETVSSSNSSNGSNGIKVTFQNVSNSKKEDSFEVSKIANDWSQNINNASSALQIAIDLFSDYTEKTLNKARGAMGKATAVKNQAKRTGKGLNKAEKALKAAIERYYKWDGINKLAKIALKEVLGFVLSVADASAKIGAASFSANYIHDVRSHGHPVILREKKDKVRVKYVEQLNQNLDKANGAVLLNIGFNVSTIAIQIAMLGKGKIAKLGAQAGKKYLGKAA